MIYLAIFLVIFVIVVLTINARKLNKSDSLPFDEYYDRRSENCSKLARQEVKKELGPVACGLLESFKNEKEKWSATIYWVHYTTYGKSKYVSYGKDIYILAYKPNDNKCYPGTNQYWTQAHGIDCKFTDYEHEVLSKYIWENFETEEEQKEKQAAENRKKNAEYFANMCPNNKKE